ncbi:MAG: O-antigen ligase family protein [Candidatus Omnitrophica bacterium]|nr:O-antigen ligase family protein [Candidatus Omnitrophota bacterium]
MERGYSKIIDNLIILALCVLVIGISVSNSVIEIAAVSAIALWFFKKIFISRNVRLIRTPLNKPILFYLIVVGASMANSRFFMTSLTGFVGKTLEYALLYFVVVETVRNEEDLKKIIWAVLFSCLLLGIDGIWQYIFKYDFLRGYQLWSMNRMRASFKFPTGFGGWLVTMIPLCFSFALFYTGRTLRTSGIILSFILLACLVLSLTRAAWIALVPAVFFIVWIKGEKAKRVLLVFLVILLLSLVLVVALGGADKLMLYTVRGHTVLHRIELTRMCWRMFGDHPLLGHGINTFMSIYESYKDASEFGGVSYAHNCYLQMAVETGALGLFAFLWIVIALTVSAFDKIKMGNDGFVRTCLIGLLSGLIAYLTHSFLETNLYALRLAVLFWLFLGLTMGSLNILGGDGK